MTYGLLRSAAHKLKNSKAFLQKQAWNSSLHFKNLFHFIMFFGETKDEKLWRS